MRIFRTQLVREVAVAVAVCAIAIHALLMAGMGSPAAGELGSMCGVAASSERGEGVPSTLSHMPDCALCGLGSCAVAPPPDIAFAILLPVAVLSAFPGDATDIDQGPFLPGATKARAPPQAA
jgi:hypothetical protein